MSTHNPTALLIGMSGQLFDRTYRICGRVVLSTDVDGERYYWQEFFLKTNGGEEATLVFEETERGPTWKLFQYFEPQSPFSIADLSRVNVGDSVGVDAFKGTVDLLGKSTVRTIEGEAPEGVERDDYSQYFNASVGDATLVVSWANGAVEHYVGHDLTRDIVRKAFGAELPASYKKTPLASTSADYGSQSIPFGKIVGFAALALFLVFQFTRCAPSSCSHEQSFSARKPPADKLEIGRSFVLAGHTQSVRSCAIVEYATASFTRQARLYELVDDVGRPSQLLLGIENDEKIWTLWDAMPVSPVANRTPQQLGALKAGSSFSHNDATFFIATLYRMRVLRIIAGSSELFPVGKIRYGFIAKGKNSWVIFDWDETSARSSVSSTLDHVP